MIELFVPTLCTKKSGHVSLLTYDKNGIMLRAAGARCQPPPRI